MRFTIINVCFISIASILYTLDVLAGSTQPPGSAQRSAPPQLGIPLTELEIVPEDLPKGTKEPEGAATRNTGGWSIDPTSRQQVRDFFFDVYQTDPNTPMGWTGDIATCDAGTTSTAFRDAILTRLNYFRAMAGVPANVTFDPVLNSKAQEAALIMAANNDLSHSPPASWTCYSADGADAAASSNLALGTNGWRAMSLYMLDWGANNTAAGHRRWLLLPQAETMGTGDVPGANALWVITSEYSNPIPPVRDGFVAWPTKGYNPYQEVPIRWSFTYPYADFSAATVSVTENGVPVASPVDSRTTGKRATIVWRPKDLNANSYFVRWPEPPADTPYTVTIDNVLIDNQPESFTYTVTVFSPTVEPDNDNDGIPDSIDPDDDNDGLTDIEETTLYNTDPFKQDTDDDGMTDGYEVDNELDPLANDANLDKDGDGFTNIDEFLAGTAANDPEDKPGTDQAKKLLYRILLDTW